MPSISWAIGIMLMLAAYSAAEPLVWFSVGDGALLVPKQFAMEAVDIISCESKWNNDAVGTAGELGFFQIHPIHKSSMEKLGLDFYKEKDRVAYAVILWKANGWNAWSCGISRTRLVVP